jgi:GH24 family phage-related lysozyme (muramidase)
VNVSKAAIALIKHHEGVRSRPYRCPANLWTVGVGHLIGDGKSLPDSWNRTFSQEEIDGILKSDLRRFELGVHKKAAMESLVKYCRAGGKILRGLQIRRLDEKALFEGK